MYALLSSKERPFYTKVQEMAELLLGIQSTLSNLGHLLLWYSCSISLHSLIAFKPPASS